MGLVDPGLALSSAQCTAVRVGPPRKTISCGVNDYVVTFRYMTMECSYIISHCIILHSIQVNILL